MHPILVIIISVILSVFISIFISRLMCNAVAYNLEMKLFLNRNKDEQKEMAEILINILTGQLEEENKEDQNKENDDSSTEW